MSELRMTGNASGFAHAKSDGSTARYELISVSEVSMSGFDEFALDVRLAPGRFDESLAEARRLAQELGLDIELPETLTLSRRRWYA